MSFRLIEQLVFGSGHERLRADRNRRQDGDGEEHRGQTQQQTEDDDQSVALDNADAGDEQRDAGNQPLSGTGKNNVKQ